MTLIRKTIVTIMNFWNFVSVLEIRYARARRINATASGFAIQAALPGKVPCSG
jgi:hypothetical protein